MNCKVYDFNKDESQNKNSEKKHKKIDKRKLMIRTVAIVCTALIFGTFCASLLFYF